jgi:NAD(P)-dependent dehydrogenase (short-subunit alcohol dehydrogenase family)
MSGLTADEVLAGLDLRGRVAVVTGASGGLGAETARSLAGAGADVVLALRDPDRASRAVAAARAAAAPGVSVTCEPLDLASLDSVHAFAAALRERGDRLDILVNNAGVMAGELARTADGFELDIGVNHLGHFALTALLANALAAAAPARVVNVSSRAHRSSDILWDDPQFRRHAFDKWTAYGQSKTANVLFTVELDRRLAPLGVRAYAVFPGNVMTDLFRNLRPEDLELLRGRVPGGRLDASPVEEGAATIVWAAASPELDGLGGVYLENCHVASEATDAGAPEGYMPHAMDPLAAARLWQWSVGEVDLRAWPEGEVGEALRPG